MSSTRKRSKRTSGASKTNVANGPGGIAARPDRANFLHFSHVAGQGAYQPGPVFFFAPHPGAGKKRLLDAQGVGSKNREEEGRADKTSETGRGPARQTGVPYASGPSAASMRTRTGSPAGQAAGTRVRT